MRPEGLEPPRVAPQDPKSCASTSSATVACCGTQLSESLRAPSGSVWIVPGDREHAAALVARQLRWLSRQVLPMGAAGADHVGRAPTQGHVDRVPGAGHHGPALRPEGNDLEGGSLDADRSPVHLEHHVFGRETKPLVPRPSTDVTIHLAAHTGPLRCFGHPRLLHNNSSGEKTRPSPPPRRQAYSGASSGDDPSTGNPSFLQ